MYDNIAHTATKNSRIHCAMNSHNGGMPSVAPMLKALRNRTAPKISSRDVAEAIGMPASTYAAYEDEKKFKKPVLPFTLAKQLAPIFAQRGVPASETMKLAGLTGDLTGNSEAMVVADEWVEVSGSVAAGVWREQSSWPEGERYDVRFGPPPFAGAERFGLRMEGLSMNRTIPPGSDLECLRVIFSSVEPQPGDLVVVERVNHDLTEMTCKRLDKDGDDWVLRCESTEPEYQEIIRIGQPDPENITDLDVRVVAIVLSAKQDFARPSLSQRRHRK